MLKKHRFTILSIPKPPIDHCEKFTWRILNLFIFSKSLHNQHNPDIWCFIGFEKDFSFRLSHNVAEIKIFSNYGVNLWKYYWERSRTRELFWKFTVKFKNSKYFKKIFWILNISSLIKTSRVCLLFLEKIEWEKISCIIMKVWECLQTTKIIIDVIRLDVFFFVRRWFDQGMIIYL